jgi:Uma2 family endonuclease
MVTHAIILGSEFDHLADDTEETLVGASYHQDAIIGTYWSLLRYGRQHALPWFVGNQLKLLAPRREGQTYSPSPDVLVHPTLGTGPRASLSVAREGPPALIIEVLSPSTGLGSDLDPNGKVGAYASMGVAEYLTFDPIGEIIPEQVRAWRLGPERRYVRWEPDVQWRWPSALGISFAPQGLRLRVFDEAGILIPDVEALDEGFNELARALQAERERRTIQDREIARLLAENARLRGEHS